MADQEHPQRVVVGMDPHKRSVTIEVMGADEAVLGGGRYGTDPAGFAAMRRCVGQFPNRVWAIEGCSGIGRHVARRLIAAGEEVVDVPPKLSAKVRVFATGQGRKTDATDAHSIALVGSGWPGYARWSPTRTSTCCGCWPTDAARSVRSTPARSPSSTPCCSSWSRAGRRRTCRRPRPRSSSPGCGHAMWPARPDAASRPSWSPIWSGSTSARRPPTKSSVSSSPRPGPGCSTCTASDPPVPRGCWSRSATSPGSPTATTSRPGPAPHPSTPRPATTSDTGYRVAGTDRSTRPSTSWPPSNCGIDPGSCLLRPQESQRQVIDGSDALPQTTTVRHRLPHHARRHRRTRHPSHSTGGGGSGRAPGQRL